MIEPTGAEYYATIAYKPRPEDERFCALCKGAGVVRRGELVPGQYGFGLPMTCPRWNAETKTCDPSPHTDHMGFEVTRLPPAPTA